MYTNTRYSNLYVSIRPKYNPITGEAWPFGYRYVVTSGSMPHIAFVTQLAFEMWLEKFCLNVVNLDDLDCDNPDNCGIHRIEGEYLSRCWTTEQFYQLTRTGKFRGFSKKVDNARYTLSILTDEAGGLICENYLNVNLNRPEFDYNKTAHDEN